MIIRTRERAMSHLLSIQETAITEKRCLGALSQERDANQVYFLLYHKYHPINSFMSSLSRILCVCLFVCYILVIFALNFLVLLSHFSISFCSFLRKGAGYLKCFSPTANTVTQQVHDSSWEVIFPQNCESIALLSSSTQGCC